MLKKIMSIKKYVENNFKKELREVSNSFRSKELNVLNDYEKTIIYKYSEDYYEFVNTNLRESKGKNIDDFSNFLIKSLKKLSDFKLLCYRSANLTSSEIKKYTSALKKKNTIIEYSFVSCSKSRLLANMFPANVTFIIHSKSAKEVEKVAKYGINSGQNEKEVIFLPNTKFEVLDIEQNEGKYVIYLQEN